MHSTRLAASAPIYPRRLMSWQASGRQDPFGNPKLAIRQASDSYLGPGQDQVGCIAPWSGSVPSKPQVDQAETPLRYPKWDVGQTFDSPLGPG